VSRDRCPGLPCTDPREPNWGRSVKPSRELRRFEPFTRHHQRKEALACTDRLGLLRTPVRTGPAGSDRLRLVAGTLRERRAEHPGARCAYLRQPWFIDGSPWVPLVLFRKNKGNPALHAEAAVLLAWASRRAGLPRPGHACPVQVQRPTNERPGPGGRGLVAFGARRVAMRRRPGIPECPGPGRVALVAEGRIRVVGPEALPAGGTVLASRGVTQVRGPDRRCALRVMAESPSGRRCRWLLGCMLSAWPSVRSGPTRRERSGRARRALGPYKRAACGRS